MWLSQSFSPAELDWTIVLSWFLLSSLLKSACLLYCSHTEDFFSSTPSQTSTSLCEKSSAAPADWFGLRLWSSAVLETLQWRLHDTLTDQHKSDFMTWQLSLVMGKKKTQFKYLFYLKILSEESHLYMVMLLWKNI